MQARRVIQIECDDTEARDIVLALEASAERLLEGAKQEEGRPGTPTHHDAVVGRRRQELARQIDNARADRAGGFVG